MPTAHHFCGTLTHAEAQPLAGIHQITATLADIDDGEIIHTAYIVFGRGDAAGHRCELAFASLKIGQRYHGSATSRSLIKGQPHHFGRVELAVDRRRASVPACMTAGAAAC